ncbi:MAG: hypothetical protein JW841_02430 [Deltaproteobacteria bacterium]|nr:hypothetical protein [Deltaproteobacteria bacterium]
MRNITFSADELLIKNARAKAASENVTLNDKFRLWLKNYIGQDYYANNYKSLMNNLRHKNSGRRFTRDEANTRH